MLSGFGIQGWLLSTGSCVANEVVNSVLMSGFTVTTSEVKPSELHILSICCGVKGSKGEQTFYIKSKLLCYPQTAGWQNHQNILVQNVQGSLAANSHNFTSIYSVMNRGSTEMHFFPKNCICFYLLHLVNVKRLTLPCLKMFTGIIRFNTVKLYCICTDQSAMSFY